MLEDQLFTMPREVLVYIGCALTHATQEFREEVEALKKELSEFCTVLQFLGLTSGTSRDVWIHDIERCVMRCNLFVAICDHPSIGLGVEFGVQTVYRQKPTIAAANYKSTVTRLVLDPKLEGQFEFVRYECLLELVPLIRTRVETIREELSRKEQTVLVQHSETLMFPTMCHLRTVQELSVVPIAA